MKPRPPSRDAPYLERLRDVRFRPVFIMGSARSGTTILYRLLAATGRFNCVTAYHLVRYDEVLANHYQGATASAKRDLSEEFRRLGITGARFDGVEVSPDFPEEYGFALAEGARMQLTPRTLPRFLELCRKVQLVAASDRPLLMKNPWDSRAFLYIKQVLPDSRFVFIHRNPAEVVRSLLEGMRSLVQERNPYHALLAGFYHRLMQQRLRLRLLRAFFSSRLFAGITRWQVARTAQYFYDHSGALPAGDYLSVRYEDLCRDPGAVVQDILRFLGEPQNEDVPYREFIRTRSRRAAADDREAGPILRRGGLKPYLASYGYDAN